jgi:glycine betaine/proline transport system ATP-binding protein
MKDGAVEQCDTPDQIVLNPATEYVRKFTEEIDKARVVHASVLAKPITGKLPTGQPILGSSSIQQLAKTLVSDKRKTLPVADLDGTVIGALDRQEALDVLLGSS